MPAANFDIELQLLLDAIYLKYHYDFRGYALASLKRRLRAAMARFGCTTLSQLQDRVLHEPGDLSERCSTSSPCRSARCSAIRRTSARSARRSCPCCAPIRRSRSGWPAAAPARRCTRWRSCCARKGCSTRTLIYATDINPQHLQKAEAGVYDVDRIAGFTENHRRSGARSSLSDYYTAAYGRAVFDKSLKRNIVFSDHSLATDSVFAEVQLVSCRNVLIYFDRALQDRALGLFRDALCRKGFLGLGAKESLRFSAQRDAFVEVVRDDRIFQKRDGL